VYDIVRKYKKKFAALETEKKSAVHRVRILDDLSKELMNVTEPEMEEVLEQLGLKT
jgi:inosine/xanthosine triphosphate pyrophosphatase family protein